MTQSRKSIVKEWVANVANSSTQEIDAASPSVLLGIALAYLDEMLHDTDPQEQRQGAFSSLDVQDVVASVDAEAFVNPTHGDAEQKTTVHQLLKEHFNVAIATPAEEELPVENFTGTIADAEHVLHPEMAYDELKEESTK